MPEPTLSEVHNAIIRCVEKIDKANTDLTDIKTGLYGPLSAPGTGFINETNTQIKSLNVKVGTLLKEQEERKVDKKWTLRAALSSLFIAFGALIKSFFFGG